MGFWDNLGKLANVILEEGPKIVSALAEEGAKKQAEIQKRTEKNYQIMRKS